MYSNGICILLAGPGHAQTLTDISIAAKRVWNYPEAWIQQWIPLLTITPEYLSTHEAWMAVEGERIVAYYSLKQDEDGLWLDNLWVLPDFMGKGIGRSLFVHALEQSRARGALVLHIEADPNAQPFYERMGAVKTGERHSEVDGQERVLPLMELRL